MANNLPVKSIEKESADFLQHFGTSLMKYAERKYNQDAFLKSVQLAILENKDLQDCLKTTDGKASLFHALRFASTTGLSLNPQEGKAALIPYGGKVTYQVMKNGLLDLAMESGVVETIISDTVRENDRFDLTKTASGDDFSFSPGLRDRGEIIGFFAAVKLKKGSTHISWMTVDEVREHRDKYARGLYYKDGNKVEAHAWHKSFEGMGLKTVIKRLFRNMSISSVLDQAIGADDQEEAGTIDIPSEGFTAEEAKAAIETAHEEKEPVQTLPDDQGSLL